MGLRKSCPWKRRKKSKSIGVVMQCSLNGYTERWGIDNVGIEGGGIVLLM